MTFKLRIVFVFILFSFLSQNLHAQYIRDSVFVGTEVRYYNIYLPKHYKDYSAFPLVLAFHGAGGWGWVSIKYQSKLSNKADVEHFIVVYPEGKRFPTSSYCGWNAGECCEPSSINNVDDVGFVNVLLDTLLNRYSIDDTRIYAAGSSNGAMFCLRLACELSERIAAIAVNAGTQTFFNCHPQRPVPTINFHSVLDSAVIYGGGYSTVPPVTYVNFISQDSMMKNWASVNQCLSIDTIEHGGDSALTLIRISDCMCNYVLMDYYITADGGHSWPGGAHNGDPVSQELVATDALWDFFKQHVISCQEPQWPNIAAVKFLTDDGQLQIYPNPVTTGVFQLYTNSSFKDGELSVIDLQGKELVKQKITSHLTTVTLDVSPGFYVVKINTSESVYSGEFLVQ